MLEIIRRDRMWYVPCSTNFWGMSGEAKCFQIWLNCLLFTECFKHILFSRKVRGESLWQQTSLSQISFYQWRKKEVKDIGLSSSDIIGFYTYHLNKTFMLITASNYLYTHINNETRCLTGKTLFFK
jgi:hypothetical protein